MSFTTFPPEIHSTIFDFACDCSEEGHVAYTLCLVSKYFLDIASPFLYRTLFVAGRSRVTSLARTLGEKPALSRHARHVFLADRNLIDPNDLEVMPDFAFSWPGTQEGRIERRKRLQDWLAARELRLSSFRTAVHRILALLAPHLRSLTLLQYARCDRHINVLHEEILALPFPKLTELTIRGNYPPFPASLSLPVLERLHLGAGEVPNLWPSFSVIADRCPRLTHLRITEPVSCVTLAVAIEVAYGVGEYNCRLLHDAPISEEGHEASPPPPPPPRLPRTLERLLLQPSPAEMSATGVAFPDYQEMIERLERLGEDFEELELVPPADRNDLPYCFESAKEDWIDRMRGGDGCWY